MRPTLVALVALLVAACSAAPPIKCEKGQGVKVFGGEYSCESCGPGKYASESGVSWHTLCFACSQGRYSYQYGQVACRPCPAGRFGASLGARLIGECSACPAGKHSPSAGSPFCATPTPPPSPLAIPLPDGATNANVCPAGMYGVPKFTQEGRQVAECHGCAAGRFAAKAGARQCVLCESGTHAPKTGAVRCAPCADGQFQRGMGRRSCVACPKGKFDTPDRDECAELPTCRPGSFLDTTDLYGNGKNRCVQCRMGTYQPTMGTTRCIDCRGNTYQDDLGTTSCKDCPHGKYQTFSGQPRCVWARGFAPAKRTADPTPAPTPKPTAAPTPKPTPWTCPAGRYMSAMYGQKFCFGCPAGKFAATAGLRACASCASGRFAGTADARACEACPGGKWQPLTGKPSCAVGRAPATAAPAAPTPAPETAPPARTAPPVPTPRRPPTPESFGLPWNHKTTAAPTQRWAFPHKKPTQPPRTQPPRTAAPSTRPPPTTTAPPTPAPALIRCNPGRFHAVGSCYECPVGKFQQLEDMPGCFECPAGKFSARYGKTVCVSCPGSKFQPVAGQTKCLRPTLAKGEHSKRCGKGQFRLGSPDKPAAPEQCHECGAGFFNPHEDAESCERCPAGKFGARTGRIACSVCAAGRAQPLVGRSECFPCQRGWFSIAGQSCRPCPAGMTNKGGDGKCHTPFPTPAPTPLSCSPGKYLLWNKCEACPRGRFQPAFGATACALCPGGKFQPSTGEHYCMISGKDAKSPARGCTGERTWTTAGSTCTPTCANPAPKCTNELVSRCQCDAPLLWTGSACVTARECRTATTPAPVTQHPTTAPTPARAGCQGGQVYTVCGIACTATCDKPAPVDYKGACSRACVARCQCPMDRVWDTKNEKCVKPGRCPLTKPTEPPLPVPLPTTTAAPTRVNCPAGRYEDKLYGMDFCVGCKPGRFRAVPTKKATCSACPFGRYQPVQGQANCISLAHVAEEVARMHPTWHSMEVMLEAQRAVGITNAPTPAPTTAPPSPAPTSFPTKAPTPEATPALMRSPHAKKGSLNCPAGRFDWSFKGTAYCMACPKGKFQLYTAATFCYACPLGKFQAVADMTSCATCTRGRFQLPHGDRASCTASRPSKQVGCAAGERGVVVGGKASCVPCLRGMVNPTKGADECTPCLAGERSDAFTTQCVVSCPKGSFSVGDRGCALCAPGRYQPDAGQPVCLICPSGKFQSARGRGACAAPTAPAACNCDPLLHPSKITKCSASSSTGARAGRIHVTHISPSRHGMVVVGDEQHKCKFAHGACRCCECRSSGGPVDVAPQEGDWVAAPYLHGGPIVVEGREQCEFACTRDAQCKVGHFGGSGKCWLSSHLARAASASCKLDEGACASFVKMVPMVQSSNLR